MMALLNLGLGIASIYLAVTKAEVGWLVAAIVLLGNAVDQALGR